MTLKLNITYEQLRDLLRQMPATERRVLMDEVENEAAQQPLTPAEKKAIYHASIMSVPVQEAPSIRRIDWYDDDGR